MAFNPELQSVYMVRHGDYNKHPMVRNPSWGNPQDLSWSTSQDEQPNIWFPLTDLGIRQMRQAAHELTDTLVRDGHADDGVVIFSSTAERAIKSSQLFLETLGLGGIDIVLSKELEEIGNGPKDMPDRDLEQFLGTVIGECTESGIIMMTHAPLAATVKLGRFLTFKDDSTSLIPNGGIVRADVRQWQRTK